MIDWSTVPVEGEQTAENTPVPDDGKSVLSPLYRSRSALGGQEIGGLAGAITGGLMGAPLGPVGSIVGSFLGAGIGGAGGEASEQVLRDESSDISRMGKAGLEEAAWDLGGNLVFKTGGKLLRLASDKLGFSKDQIPDATKAAQEFLQRQGSSLTKPALYDSSILQTGENLVVSPATKDIFVRKQKEISDALQAGNKDLLASLAKSPEFQTALRQGTSAQKASGEVLLKFIKEGEEALSSAVAPEYTRIFSAAPRTNLIETTTGGMPKISTFGLNSWASNQLVNKETLTAGQKSILSEIKNLPPSVNFDTLHQIRSRWLAENRDKYASNGTEKDSLASKTITGLVSKIDEAMDFSAGRTLPPDLLKDYRKVTKTYREGVQGLQTEAIQEALTKAPEEVGSFLFTSGKETPINELYKSIASAGKLSNRSSKEVMDALRYGYLQALTNTPENMLKFANELEQNQSTRNTFNVLFDSTQKKAIEAMNTAAKKGLIEPAGQVGGMSRGTSAIYGAGALGATAGYAFLLSPEQQERLKENLGSAAVATGALILNQRTISRMLLDPKGAKTLTLLSTARDKLTSPSAFTKLIAEPLANFYSDDPLKDALVNERPSVNWESTYTMSDKLVTQLRRDEGEILTAYQDHLGYWTIGVGILIDARKGGGLLPEESEFILQNRVKQRREAVAKALPWTDKLDEARKGVLLNMSFQLGLGGLLGFKNTLEQVRLGNYAKAAEMMLNSKWAEQTPARAKRLAKQMETGEWV